MKIYYVTGNMGKLKLAQDFLKGIDVDMLTYDFEEPDVNDIEYIAKWKVKKAYDKIKKPCMALDSGFYIPSYPKEKASDVIESLNVAIATAIVLAEFRR